MTRNPVSNREALAALLPSLRKSARVSQLELSRLAGLSRETINLIERAATNAKAETLRQIADGLATNGDGEQDAGKAAEYYQRLMLAAGHIDAGSSEVKPVKPRSVEDLTDEEVEEALAKISKDPEFTAEFMAVAEDWSEMSTSAQRAAVGRQGQQAVGAHAKGYARPAM